MPRIIGDCYDQPRWFDLAFSDETRREADFVEAACNRYGLAPTRQLLDLGCGGGRMVVEMARRGLQVVGIDYNPHAVKYTRSQLRKRALPGQALLGDIRDFKLTRPVDAAICTFNTFRHLLSEADARRHLKCVARALRPGGIYVLGFHLLPLDVAEESEERWAVRRGHVQVNAVLRVLTTDRRRRRERLQFTLRVRTPSKQFRLRSEFDFRMYTAAQFRRLLAAVAEIDFCDVFDFWYEIDHPLKLDDRLTDAVFVMRRG